MMIHLPSSIEARLRKVAQETGREVSAVAEEAVQFYLDAAALSDLSNGQIAQTQMKLLKEMADFPSDHFRDEAR